MDWKEIHVLEMSNKEMFLTRKDEAKWLREKNRGNKEAVVQWMIEQKEKEKWKIMHKIEQAKVVELIYEDMELFERKLGLTHIWRYGKFFWTIKKMVGWETVEQMERVQWDNELTKETRKEWWKEMMEAVEWDIGYARILSWDGGQWREEGEEEGGGRERR